MGWDPRIGQDPVWWLGAIVGFCAVVFGAAGVAMGRRFR